MNPNTRWFVRTHGAAPRGPWTTAQVIEGMKSGTVAPNAEVNLAGTPSWFRVDMVAEFREVARDLKVQAAQRPAVAAAPTPPRPERRKEATWYVARPGAPVVGPLTRAAVSHLVASGQVGRDATLRRGEAGDWRPITSIPKLLRHLPEEKGKEPQRAAVVESPVRVQEKAVAAAATQPVDARLWYVANDRSEPVGPVSTERVKQGILAGKIPATARLNLAGTRTWSKLAEMAEFAACVPDDQGARPTLPVAATPVVAGAEKSGARDRTSFTVIAIVVIGLLVLVLALGLGALWWWSGA